MKSRRRTAVIAVAVVIVIGGVAAGTGVAVAANAETVRQCDVARGKLTAADTAAKKANAAARAAVKGSETTNLPNTDGWTSKKYADKPASTAQPKGSSGQDRLGAVASQQKKLQSLATSPLCESRDDADAVTARATALTNASGRLTAAAKELEDDFTTFQADETTRIAAEHAAAAKKAAEEAAAKQAAEEEAARQTQAAEAARQAAAAAAARPAPPTGASPYRPSAPAPAPAPAPASGGGGVPGGDRVTSPWGSTAPQKGPDFVGGGGVGSGGGGCWTSNGHGGSIRC
ncbi:hypothetical protein [Curtobacterium sp. MCSS17_016]|uniref:hypothetical protein n=1 Tax=Curtobacterium sp. MCSS17_016 TaxID=2175644 RepID=UPI000DA918B6|nr:hypothetical protein [Curtobacterium sp. MCSS17_016]WIE81486.1 hypothetical protein DEJ19_019815 [Curtobacterium sp. MCSS17_016]